MRYVLEGEWTGYRSSQQRIVHREVISEKRAKRLKDLHKIVYSDGTALHIFIRELKVRERIVPIDGYAGLIRSAEDTGKAVVMVRDL